MPVLYDGNYLTPTDAYTAEERVQRGRAQRFFSEGFGISVIERVNRPKPSGRALEYLTEKEVWQPLKDRRWRAVNNRAGEWSHERCLYFRSRMTDKNPFVELRKNAAIDEKISRVNRHISARGGGIPIEFA